MYLIISDYTLKKSINRFANFVFVFFLVIEASINPMAIVSKIDITFWMNG